MHGDVFIDVLRTVHFPDEMHGLEVGVFEGSTSVKLLTAFPGLILGGVDPYCEWPQSIYPTGNAYDWKQRDWDKCRDAMLERLKPFAPRFEFLQMVSTQAMTLFDDEALDFVYVDGNHTYPYVLQDCEGWWPKVRKGGILGGDDWGWNEPIGGVAKAVTEFCKKINCPYSRQSSNVWVIQKP